MSTARVDGFGRCRISILIIYVLIFSGTAGSFLFEWAAYTARTPMSLFFSLFSVDSLTPGVQFVSTRVKWLVPLNSSIGTFHISLWRQLLAEDWGNSILFEIATTNCDNPFTLPRHCA